jgi:hypothetical protein
MVEPKLQGTTNLDQAKELLERRAEFHRRLIDLVVQQHGQFLKGQVNGAPPPTGAEYTIHWHPKFPLESVADIKPAELPEPPTAQQQQSFLSSLKKNDELGSYQAILDKQIKKPFVPLARSAQTDATSSAVNKEYDPEEEILEQVRALAGSCTTCHRITETDGYLIGTGSQKRSHSKGNGITGVFGTRAPQVAPKQSALVL